MMPFSTLFQQTPMFSARVEHKCSRALKCLGAKKPKNLRILVQRMEVLFVVEQPSIAFQLDRPGHRVNHPSP